MLGQRLNARAIRHQRLARRLRARHALFERRDAVQQLRAGRGRGRALVRFLRPIAWTPAALAASASPPDELIAPADVAFVDEATPAAPTVVVSATEEEVVSAARAAAPATDLHRAQPEATPSAPPVETRRTPIDAQVVDTGPDGGSGDEIDEPLPQRDAMPAMPRIESPSEPTSAALPELPTQVTNAAPDTVTDVEPAAPQTHAEPVTHPSAPAELRVARPIARHGAHAIIETESAPELAAPEPSIQLADETAEVAEATVLAAELPSDLPARLQTPLSEPALSTPPEPLDAETLFAPREPDERAPASWLERLTRAAAGERAPEFAVTPESASLPAARVAPVGRPNPARQRSTAADSPDTVRLPPSARRFLRPLVGVEPDDVPLRVGPLADEAVAAQAADALAFEGRVVLGAEAARTLDAPRSLGLLAHELTHVARRSAPRFVPPVARGGNAGPPPTDEEALATRVEARVVHAAEQGVDGSSLAAPNEFVAPRRRSRAARRLDAATRPSTTAGLPDSPSQPALHAPPHAPSPDAETFDFGGLPAPWEPFPSWITDTFAPEPAMDSPVAATALNGVSAPPPVSTGPLVQRAGEERSLETPAAASGELARTAAAAPPPAPPDLDELARQVYGILRRRLAAEARRAG